MGKIKYFPILNIVNIPKLRFSGGKTENLVKVLLKGRNTYFSAKIRKLSFSNPCQGVRNYESINSQTSMDNCKKRRCPTNTPQPLFQEVRFSLSGIFSNCNSNTFRIHRKCYFPSNFSVCPLIFDLDCSSEKCWKSVMEKCVIAMLCICAAIYIQTCRLAGRMIRLLLGHHL